MAFYDTTWYISSVAYAAVTQWAASTAYTAGQRIRQLANPGVGAERVYVCVVAGTSATTEGTPPTTRGAAWVTGTATFRECTGMVAVNGDIVNTPTSSAVRSAAISNGVIIKNNSAAHYFMCTGAGTAGASEPTYNTTAGATTADGTCIWTCIGPVGNFPTWGAPHARLANAYTATWGAAGNKFWLPDNHAETQATAMTLPSPATAAAGPTYTICVDRTAVLPPIEVNYNTGATISTTGAVDITLSGSANNSGSCYYQGIGFSAGNGSTASSNINMAQTTVNFIFKNCAFVLANSNAANAITIGSNNTLSRVLWDNTTVQFSSTGQSIAVRNAYFEWRNTPNAIQGATIPASLFTSSGAAAGISTNVLCRGIDFSAFTGTLVTPIASSPYVFEDCKFNASMTRMGAVATTGDAVGGVITVRCDSGATNYKATRDEYAGSQVTETSITRVSGGTDGTTPQSEKIVTNAQAALLTPYRMLPLAIWNDTTGVDVTVTVCGTINAGSLPLNDELWLDVQYLGSGTSPIASFKSTAKSHPLAIGVAVASDGSSWNGGGSGAGWTPFKLVTTLTSPQPQMKGYLYVNVRVAKVSATYYIDPLPVLS